MNRANTLEQELKYRPISLDDNDILHIRHYMRKNKELLQGHVIEEMVKRWLRMCGVKFEKGFPYDIGKFSFAKGPTGIDVYRRYEKVYEFDFMVSYNDQPYVIQVKSNRLRDTTSMIARGITFGEIFYEMPVKMLLFHPQHCKERKLASEVLELFHPQLRCIDLGYTPKELKAFVKKHLIA